MCSQQIHFPSPMGPLLIELIGGVNFLPQRQGSRYRTIVFYSPIPVPLQRKQSVRYLISSRRMKEKVGVLPYYIVNISLGIPTQSRPYHFIEIVVHSIGIDRKSIGVRRGI